MPRKRRRITRKEGETRGRKPLVELTLTLRHTINGTAYGPGPVRVSEPIGQVLAEQERNFHEVEGRLHQAGAHIISGNRVIPVRADFFDMGGFSRLDPSIQISGS